MKKILFVTNHLQYSDGVARALVGFANVLAQSGYEVTVMPVFIYDSAFAKEFCPDVKIKKMFGGYFKGLSKIVGILPQKALYGHYVKDEYDIEVAFQYGIPTKMIAASKNKNALKLAWMHGYGEDHLIDHEKFDKIVSCSKSNAEEYKEVFKFPERVTHLYNLIDDKEITEKSQAQINIEKNGKFTFCSVGRLSPEKGFLRLIKCHEKLIEEGLDNNLWIIGGGSEAQVLQNYVAEHDLGGGVVLTGQDNNPYKYIKQSDVFVCSSYREGFSTVCTEAAILGKAIITTEVGGAKELVADNHIGIMTANTDEALYEGMKSVLLDPRQLSAYVDNIGKIPDLRFEDRKKEVLEFFGALG